MNSPESPRTASRWPTGPGIDQGGARLERIVVRSATPLLNERIELPTSTRIVFIEAHPFEVGECFLSPAKPAGALGAARVGDIFHGLDVAKFDTLGVEGVDQLFLNSSVAPGVADDFVIIALVGGLWVERGGAGGGGTGTVVAGTVGQGVVSVADADVQLVAANATRINVRFENMGITPVAIVEGAGPAVFASAGIILWDQGDSYTSGCCGAKVQSEWRAIRQAGAPAENVGVFETST